MSASNLNPNPNASANKPAAMALDLNLNVNLSAAPTAAVGGRVPLTSPIADFSFVSDLSLPSAFHFDAMSVGAGADPALDLNVLSAMNALRASNANANSSAAGAPRPMLLPSPSPPPAFGLPLGLVNADALMPPVLPALPAAAAGSLLVKAMDTSATNSVIANAAAAAAAAHAHPFSFASHAHAFTAPNSPGLSLAGDTDPDSPSSIASDLSSTSSLLATGSANASPRSVLSSLPRHSSTPSLAALSAYPSPATHLSRAAAPAPNLPSLKPALRSSSSKGNLSATASATATPKMVAMSPALSLPGAAGAAARAAALNSFSLSGTGSAVQVPNAPAPSEAVEQPSKKKQKANDASMRRVKSSPAVAHTAGDSDDEDEEERKPSKRNSSKAAAARDALDSDDDDEVDAERAARLKDLNKPISLFTKDGKPKSEAEIKREKAERRLAKKAEAARQSRKRKKAYVQQLEDKAAKLEARLAALEANAAAHSGTSPAPASAHAHASPALHAVAHSPSLSPASASAAGVHPSAAAMSQATSLHALHRAEQSEVLKEMAKAVTSFVALASAPAASAANNSAGNASAANNEKERARVLEDVKALIERYVVNSRKRQSTVTYYLDRLTELLSPEAAVKVALWGLMQPDSFYALSAAAAADPKLQAGAGANHHLQAGAVFSSLMASDVGLSGEQLSKLVSEFRAPVAGVMGALRTTAGHLSELREYVKSHIAARNRHVDELRHILNPIQVANYLLWLDRNPLLANKLAATSAAGAAVTTATAVAPAGAVFPFPAATFSSMAGAHGK